MPRATITTLSGTRVLLLDSRNLGILVCTSFTGIHCSREDVGDRTGITVTVDELAADADRAGSLKSLAMRWLVDC